MVNVQTLPDGSKFDADNLGAIVKEEKPGEFVIVVYETPINRSLGSVTVITVGVEKSRAAARKWADDCISAFKRGEKEPPDAKERGEWSPASNVLTFKR